MRVAMISYHTCPLATLGGKDTGGMNVYVRDLSRHLGMAGVGVDVYTRSQDEHVPHVLHDLGYGNRVIHVPAGPESPLQKTNWIDHVPEFVQNVKSIARGKGLEYDLIHSHYWLSGLSSFDLRDAWGIPLIQTFHTLGIMKDRVARSAEDAAVSRRIQTEKDLLRKADLIVASTQAELAQFQWLYKSDISKVRVVPPGVDLTRFYPIPSDEAKEFVGLGPTESMILYVGRIEPLKGIDTLLRAMAELNRRGSLQRRCQCLVVIGGEPNSEGTEQSPEMERLFALRDELGLDDMIAFYGSRDQDTLPYYYSAAELVVVPSHYESFGLVALEAMACGKPVVASETGGLAFLVKDGETGFHVPAAEPSALADRLELLLSDQDLRIRMGGNARAYAKGYAWPLITKSMLGVYHEVMAEDVVA
jgi:D-inositol-3-phosphate glycosyltransferase